MNTFQVCIVHRPAAICDSIMPIELNSVGTYLNYPGLLILNIFGGHIHVSYFRATGTPVLDFR